MRFQYGKFKKQYIHFSNPQNLLAILQQIPDSAAEFESLLHPINESLALVRDKINKGENAHIPYLQTIIDKQPKDVNFQEQYDKFISELKPFDRQCRALSMSLIMVVSLEIKNVAMIASEIFKIHDPNSGWTLQRVMEMSNDCLETSWAEGIHAASNYVRHSDEWRLLPIRKTKNGKPLKMDAFERLKEELPKEHGQVISNLKIIQKLGISPEKIVFEHKEISFRLVEILGLNNLEIVIENFKAWSEQIYSRAHKLIR